MVVGDNAGESKLSKIKSLSIATVNEDEFLNMIATRKGAPMDEKAIKAKEKEVKKIEDAAKEMEKREKEEEQLRKRKEKALAREGVAVKYVVASLSRRLSILWHAVIWCARLTIVPCRKVAPPSSQLWTTKYAPTNLKEICGNKANVDRLGAWLQAWSVTSFCVALPSLQLGTKRLVAHVSACRDNNYKSGFKKPGKDGMGIYRAILISGPPGIGKTTSAHLMAKEAGYSPIELNASDARSKKLVEVGQLRDASHASRADALDRTRPISIMPRSMASSRVPASKSVRRRLHLALQRRIS